MLEDLIFNSKSEKEFNLGKHKIKIRLLDSKETKEIFELIHNLKDDTARTYGYLSELVSRCLVSVNDNLVTYNEAKEKIDKVSDLVISEIYKKYSELKLEVDAVVKNELEIKN